MATKRVPMKTEVNNQEVPEYIGPKNFNTYRRPVQPEETEGGSGSGQSPTAEHDTAEHDTAEHDTAEQTPANAKTDPLWAQIRQEVKDLKLAFRTGSTHAINLGQYLVLVKKLTPHGQWLSSLSANCDLDERQVQRYMSLFNNQGVLNKIDPDWKDKYGIQEALDLVTKHEAEQSQAAIGASRAASKTAPTAKSAAKRRPVKARAASFGELRSHLTLATKEISAVVKAIGTVDQEQTISKVEEQARKMQKECSELIKECEKRREALKPLEAKSSGNPKSADSNWAAPKNDEPTAKRAKNSLKRSRATGGSFSGSTPA